MKKSLFTFLAVALLLCALLLNTGVASAYSLAWGEFTFKIGEDYPFGASQTRLIANAKYTTSYYEQLTEFEKTIYDTRVSSLPILRTGTAQQIVITIEGDVTVEEFISAFYNAVYAFDYDHPEVFWLSKTMRASYMYNSSTNLVTRGAFGIPDEGWHIDAYPTEADVLAAESEFNAKVDELMYCAQGTAFDKYLYFHDWLVNNNYYNSYVAEGNIAEASDLAWSAAGALIRDESDPRQAPVCEAYSRAFKVLCDAAGLECAIVSGYAGEAHMWNYVKMHNNVWYAVDITWDDPIASTPILSHNFFLVGSNKFFRDHTEIPTIVSGIGGAYAFPVINKTNYPLAEEGNLGNVNGDNDINTGDVATILRYIIGAISLEGSDLVRADFNTDEAVNTGDASLILQYLLV